MSEKKIVQAAFAVPIRFAIAMEDLRKEEDPESTRASWIRGVIERFIAECPDDEAPKFRIRQGTSLSRFYLEVSPELAAKMKMATTRYGCRRLGTLTRTALVWYAAHVAFSSKHAKIMVESSSASLGRGMSETRLRLVEDWKANGGTISGLALKYGVVDATAARWMRAAGAPPPRSRESMQKTKAEVVKALKQGADIAELARKHGISRVTVAGWRRELRPRQ